MEITAKMVKDLREQCGAGMMDCKKALEEAGGDLDKAVDVLRTKGLADLAKKAGRATNEGVIAAYVSDDAKTGVLVEVNCETDFVARNGEFQSFVNDLAAHIAKNAPADVDALKAQTFTGREHTVEQVLGEMVSKLGENMGITRFARREAGENGAIGSYIHGGGRIGVLVEGADMGDSGTALLRDIAMQVAAASPAFARREEVPADVSDHEMSIYKAQAAESGKPEPIQEKIAQGRLDKYFKEVCLVEQPFVKDPDVTVAKHVERTVGKDAKIVGFTRFVLGETGAAAE